MKFFLLLFFIQIAVFAQEVELIKNISTGTEGIEVLRKHFDGENIFFVSKDKSNVQTLWFYNNALNTFTSLQTDEEKTNQYPFGSMVLYKNKVYWAKGSIWERELWVSDGTVAGTQILNSNIGSFSQSRIEDELKGFSYGKFMPAKNILYFYSKPQNQWFTTLWRTDGTSSGTFIVDYTNNSNGMTEKGSENDFFYYKKNSDSNGGNGSQDLWLSNGQSISKVTTIHPSHNQGYFDIISYPEFHTISVDSSGYKKLLSISIQNPQVLLEIIPKSYAPNNYFSYNQSGFWNNKGIINWSLGNNNPEIWRTDGTVNGTFPITNSSSTSSSNNNYGELGQYMFMGGYFDNSGSYSLAIVDKKNTDLHIVTNNGFPIYLYQNYVSQGIGYVPKAFSDGKLYIIRDNGKSLFEIDTTSFLATERFIIPNNDPNFYSDLRTVNNKLIVTKNKSGFKEDELFIVSNSDLYNITDSIIGTKPTQLRILGTTNTKGYFIGYHPEFGKELWQTNGTSVGTQLLMDLNTKPSSSSPHSFVPFAGGIFMLADDGKTDDEPWFSDGEPEGTKLKFDIWGYTPPPPNGSVKWGNYVYTLFGGNYLSKIDTVSWSWARSTSLLVGSNYKTNFVKLGNSLFYAGYGLGEGVELFSISSTGYSSIVRDIYNTSSIGSNPRNLTLAGNYIYFAAEGNTTGTELYKTDGTFSGTTIVADMSPGYASSNLTNFKSFQNELIFVKDSSKLWKSNGSSPILIHDFGTNVIILDSMVIFNSELYFGVKNGSNPGLYRLTASQNVELVNDCDFSNFKELYSFIFNNALYFTSSQGLKRLKNQAVSLAYQDLKIKFPTLAFGKVYFNGTYANESEIWSLDSLETIKLEFNINPGSSGSNPENLTLSANSLFFSATKDDIGCELFRITDCPAVRSISLISEVNPVKASKFINSIEILNENKTYVSGRSILLSPGFITKPQFTFSAKIGGCNN